MKSKFLVLPFLFFLLILLVPCASAEDIEKKVLENPAGVNELTVEITQYGTVEVDGTPTSLAINLSIPQDDDRQDVSMDIDSVKDEFGVDIGVIEQSDPDNPFSYSFTGTIKSRANHLTSLPSSYTIPNDVEVFLQPTENIQSSDPRFKNLADEITEGSKDDFEKVAKLAMWVYDYLTYDLSYSGNNEDAVSVLDEKRGVCAEYTTLFVALARSIGIPAKYVSAYAYGEQGWERHAYAEVYLGKWIPVDPLWLEIGYMDATHIRFGDHADNRVRNNLEYSGYDLEGSPRWVEDDVELRTVSYSPIEKVEDYELAISSEDFRRGDEGVVTFSITPTEFIVGSVSLEPCTGQYDIAEVEDKKRNIILRPGEKEQLSWKISINPDLPKNYIFSCPLMLNSRSLALKSINATVRTSSDRHDQSKITARLSSDVLEFGDEQTVYIEAQDMGGSWLGIVAGDEHEKYFVESRGLVTSFKFTPERLGAGEVIVYTSEGEVVTLEYEVTSEVSIAIEDFVAPEYLKIGERKNVSANIVNRGRSEESVRVNVRVEGEDNLANFMLKDAYHVSLPVSFRTAGMKTVRIELSGAQTELSKTGMIEVYEDPVVTYDAIHEDGKGILKLDVTKSRIKDVAIKIGGIEKRFDVISGQKDVEFSLSPGQYAMEISAKDIAGNPLAITETIEFREKNIIELILDMINSFIGQIMSLFNP